MVKLARFCIVIGYRFALYRWLVGGALALQLIGCGKKSSPSATAAPASASNEEGLRVPGQVVAQTRVGPPPAANPVPVQPIVIENAGNTTAVLAQLTQALRKFSAEQRRVPQSFSEVIGAGYVGSMPAAPAGKKFAVDRKHLEVVLVNQ